MDVDASSEEPPNKVRKTSEELAARDISNKATTFTAEVGYNRKKLPHLLAFVKDESNVCVFNRDGRYNKKKTNGKEIASRSRQRPNSAGFKYVKKEAISDNEDVVEVENSESDGEVTICENPDIISLSSSTSSSRSLITTFVTLTEDDDSEDKLAIFDPPDVDTPTSLTANQQTVAKL
uniref:Uncharacterized protein n=1 Tax=Panagrolaimus sp. ES5 TaxID=591445 RepID=A0AC34GUR8_9BILA